MTAVALAIVTYSAQVGLVVGIAGVAMHLASVPYPRARLYFWRAVLALCALLPFLGVGWAAVVETTATVTAPIAATTPAAGGLDDRTSLMAWVPWGIAAGVVGRLAWLLLGGVRLRQLRAHSTALTLPPACRVLRESLAPQAEIRASTLVSQPVAFGWLHPTILLPESFVTLDPDEQTSVICHELEHIARRDWLWILGEEVVRAVFWFHPAIWWVLAQLHLGREQVVDHAVVTRTGLRQAYMNALLRFAEAPRLTPAMPLLRRGHLGARLSQLTREVFMSTPRFVGTVSAVSLVVIAAATTIALLLPVNVAGLMAQAPVESNEPGVVKPTATTSGKPVYPQAAKDAKITGDVLISAVVGTDGLVHDARVTKSLDTVYGLDQAALDSMRDWRFRPGTKNGTPVPVRVDMLVTFRLR